jgi:hypothetical protein
MVTTKPICHSELAEESGNEGWVTEPIGTNAVRAFVILSLPKDLWVCD